MSISNIDILVLRLCEYFFFYNRLISIIKPYAYLALLISNFIDIWTCFYYLLWWDYCSSNSKNCNMPSLFIPKTCTHGNDVFSTYLI